MELPWLDTHKIEFPAIQTAQEEPNGLLAAGGDLSVERLLFAYRLGIFPWYEEGQPILWWSPSPRCVLVPSDLHISRSLRKTINKGVFNVTADACFEDVMRECAAPRNYTDNTWITDDMLAAYTQLHDQGHAHSVEVWQDDQLVGGLYGVAVGGVFFGESMFAKANDASKVAMVFLVRYLQKNNYQLIDCQVKSDHIMSLGACEIDRREFQRQLEEFTQGHQEPTKWRFS